jgi:hypothetical protein
MLIVATGILSPGRITSVSPTNTSAVGISTSLEVPPSAAWFIRQEVKGARASASSTGEAVACGEDRVASFDRIRYRWHDASVFLYAFDPIGLDGDDLRRDPLDVLKGRSRPCWPGPRPASGSTSTSGRTGSNGDRRERGSHG